MLLERWIDSGGLAGDEIGCIALIGDEAADVTAPFPSRSDSNTFEGCVEALECDELEVFLLSWFCLVENWTSKGEDG